MEADRDLKIDKQLKGLKNECGDSERESL